MDNYCVSADVIEKFGGGKAPRPLCMESWSLLACVWRGERKSAELEENGS